MKVCLRSREEAEKGNIQGWLHLDREYIVLCIEVDMTRGVQYRIASSQGTPALFDARLFTITDPAVDMEWIVQSGISGNLSLEPEAWSAPGFWEDYFNLEPAAIAKYSSVLQRMTGGVVKASRFAWGQEVRLRKAYPNKNLKIGQKGTVVLAYEDKPDTYEIEFKGHDGEILAVDTFRVQDLADEE